ncbi:MAG: VWA domain-containing protein [bacterium]|nr:VWA domain-containing protein [bacterium]
MDIRAVLDREKVRADKPGLLHLMVSVRPAALAAATRKPIDVVLVLDVSTSMSEAATDEEDSPSKLRLMQEAALAFGNQLQNGDRVSVVRYSDDAQVILPLTALTAQSRDELQRVLKGLRVIGGTNLVGGTLRGLGVLGECTADAERTCRVILFTDGLPTIGVTKHADVVTTIQACAHTPITTIGFGAKVVANGVGYGGYDPELLTAIARMSGGNFYHAKDRDGILTAFGEELGALRSVAAADVVVRIKPGSTLAFGRVLNDLPTTAANGATAVAIGNIYADETQYVVVELVAPAVEKIFPRDVLAAAVEVSGVEVASGAFKEQRDAHFRYARETEADAEPDQAVEEQRMRLAAARAIEEAYRQAARHDYTGATQTIDAIIVMVEKVKTPEGATLLQILQVVRVQVKSPANFAQHGGDVHATAYGVATRRSTGDGVSRVYRTAAQDQTIVGMGVVDEHGQPKKN